jgi:Fe-S-cluster containining protein
MTVYFGHTQINLENDDQEFGLYFQHHHCQITKRELDDGSTCLGVRIPLVCKHLSLKGGVASCRVYEKRPVICKNYLCQRAKGTEGQSSDGEDAGAIDGSKPPRKSADN